jgi:hypothetical protein
VTYAKNGAAGGVPVVTSRMFLIIEKEKFYGSR